MLSKNNWAETKQKFEDWWRGENVGRPLMYMPAVLEKPQYPLIDVEDFTTPEDRYTNVEKAVKRFRNDCASTEFLAESFPHMSMDFGPGSLALYLGSTPNFQWDTVWFRECMHDIGADISFDENNFWWNKHRDTIAKAHELSGGDFYVNIPDIVENLDVLAAMRGAEKLLYDIMDEPEAVRAAIKRLDELYFKYYDALYDIVKDNDGGSSYTAFNIWGQGKTAKVQCDFSCFLSPDQFSEFVVPSLEYQCNRLDKSLYHLDGPDAIKHLDALMGIEKLNALQWMPGAGNPDGGHECWYEIHDKVRKAGKSISVFIYDGDLQDRIASADRLVDRYGTAGLCFVFYHMDIDSAQYLLEHAQKNWK